MSRARPRCVLALVGVLAGGASAAAQSAAPSRPEVWGAVVMAHGGDTEWDRLVEEAVAPLRESFPVEIAFGMAECRTLRDAIDRLEARGVTRIAVVRLFVRSESFRGRIEYILGLRPDPPPGESLRYDCCRPGMQPHECGPIAPRARIVLTAALDGDAMLGPILAERAAALSREPAREVVLILSHGLGDDEANARLLADIERAAEHVRRGTAHAEVRAETLREDWEEKRAPVESNLREWVAAANARGDRVLVIPYRVAGFGPYAEVLDGLDYVADGRGFLPHPSVTRWIRERFETAREGGFP